TARAAQEKLEAAQAQRDSTTALDALAQQARGKRAQADRLRAEWHRLNDAHPIEQQLPWAPVRQELLRLKKEVERLQDEAVEAEKRHRALAVAAVRTREVADRLRSLQAQAGAEAALREARANEDSVAQALQQNAYQRLQARLGGFLAGKGRFFLLALAILLGAILARLAVKLLLYYVVAPFASGRAPVRLMAAYEARAFVQAGA